MLFKTSNDWKQFLSIEDEELLNDLLKKIMKYRGAYKNAEDVKSSQMWCAILELKKENLMLKRKIESVDSFLEFLNDYSKRKDKDKEELLRSLDKF